MTAPKTPCDCELAVSYRIIVDEIDRWWRHRDTLSADARELLTHIHEVAHEPRNH